MDTLLGNVKLKKQQVLNLLHETPPVPFKGFMFWADGRIIGVSEVEPTTEEIDNALVFIKAISDTPSSKITEKTDRIQKVTQALKTLGLTDQDIKETFKDLRS